MVFVVYSLTHKRMYSKNSPLALAHFWLSFFVKRKFFVSFGNHINCLLCPFLHIIPDFHTVSVAFDSM